MCHSNSIRNISPRGIGSDTDGGVSPVMYEGSAVTQQAWDHNHRIGWMSVCVLGSESLRLAREAIHIQRLPTFLKDRGSFPEVIHMMITSIQHASLSK